MVTFCSGKYLGFKPVLCASKHSAAALPSQIEAEIVALYKSHSATLHRYASVYAMDPMTIQDGVQEAFRRYFIARTDGARIDNPRAWLMRTLRNCLIDSYRRLSPPTGIDAADNSADPAPNALVGVTRNEKLRNLFPLLSSKERECLRLRIGGFSYSEISEIMHIRSSTVGVLMYRILKKARSEKLITAGTGGQGTALKSGPE